MKSIKNENNIKTINDVFANLTGVFDIFNKNGEEIDDLEYPDDTEVLDVLQTDKEYYQVIMNV